MIISLRKILNLYIKDNNGRSSRVVSLPSTLQYIKFANEELSTSEATLQLQATTMLTKSIHHDLAEVKTHVDKKFETIHGDLEAASVQSKSHLTTLTSRQDTLEARISTLEVKVGNMDEKLDTILAMMQPDSKKGDKKTLDDKCSGEKVL